MSGTLFALFGFPGHLELLIVGFVILLLFGHRLPGMMRSLGRGFVEFKHGLKGDESDKETEEIGQDDDSSDEDKQ